MDFSQFIIKLKETLQENEELSIYPELSYKNVIYSINAKGELYNKTRNLILTQQKTLEIFKSLFNHGDFRFSIKEVFEI
jgi:rRNA pseudouridine-1189 N-methylase Emg1 (Nep1/Mra1 family)